MVRENKDEFMPWFETARFHVDFGPDSLFERVKFKLASMPGLLLHERHFNDRLVERSIPEEIIESCRCFNFKDWRLVTAEVRIDRGKFVNSTWERELNGKRYWITIGFGGCIKTIVVKKSHGYGKVITNGEFYDYVQKVNKALMDDEIMPHEEELEVEKAV